MPTGLLNVVCDECYGGEFVILATGERQLQHQPNCMWKYREDTFLIELTLALDNCKHFIYPEEAKLNPIIYDLLYNGYFTEGRNETFSKRGESKAQKRANKINKNFQIVKEALKEDGRWDEIRNQVIKDKPYLLHTGNYGITLVHKS